MADLSSFCFDIVCNGVACQVALVPINILPQLLISVQVQLFPSVPLILYKAHKHVRHQSLLKKGQVSVGYEQAEKPVEHSVPEWPVMYSAHKDVLAR